MENDPKIDEAREKLAILRKAQAYKELLRSEGWTHLQQAQTDWLTDLLRDLKDTKTSSPEDARDALRRWQIAEELVDRQTRELNQAFTHADEIRGDLNIETAVLMETMTHEYAAPGDPGSGNPTGY